LTSEAVADRSPAHFERHSQHILDRVRVRSGSPSHLRTHAAIGREANLSRGAVSAEQACRDLLRQIIPETERLATSQFLHPGLRRPERRGHDLIEPAPYDTWHHGLQRLGEITSHRRAGMKGDHMLHNAALRIMHYMHSMIHRSMQTTDIIEAVNVTLRSTRTRQSALAAFCRVTQGHISKVLARQVTLSAGMEQDLAAWLATVNGSPSVAGSEMEQAVERLRGAPEEKRMHILHILSSLSALI